jgi:hypothetical protein
MPFHHVAHGTDGPQYCIDSLCTLIAELLLHIHDTIARPGLCWAAKNNLLQSMSTVALALRCFWSQLLLSKPVVASVPN